MSFVDRFRSTIAIPILVILLFMTTGILLTGYYINKSVFYNVFEERENNKLRNLHLTIESLISREEKRIAGFAKVLKRDSDIAYAVYHYKLTGGDTKPLKSVMDQLHSQMNLPVFLMADAKGKILYRADRSKGQGRPILAPFEAFDRARKGEQVLTAARLPDGWGLRAIVPFYAFDKKIPAGILILGTRIDNDFAKRIARETDSQVLIAIPEGVIAASHGRRDPQAIDLEMAKKSLSGKKPLFLSDRQNFRAYSYVPLKVIDQEFCLVIETDISVVEELLDKNRVQMAQWGMILFLGVALIGGAFTIALIQPLTELQKKARQVVREYSGEESRAIPRGNEISTLVRAFHLMVETVRDHISRRTKAEEALRQSQKMEAIGKLAGGVAHDFNNLLSVITGYSELLLARLGPDARGLHEIEEIRKAGERAASLTHQLLAFSRRQVLTPKPVRMNEAVTNVGKMLTRLIGENIELVINVAPDLGTVVADPVQIDQILINLAVNARDAMPEGGKLALSTANVEFALPLVEGDLNIPAGDYVALEVTDTGCGMTPETLARIFEPFFTTKERGKGTGLGLATVYGIVSQSGGYIRVRSVPGAGTTFLVYFPRSRDDRSEPGSEGTAMRELCGHETILLVEDEEMVRNLASETLRGYGYTVLEASNGEEATSVSSSNGRTIQLLVADVVMPGISGLELARRLKAARPDLRVLFMSGYSEEAVTRLGVMGAGEAFLQKPVTPTLLASKVREVLSAPGIVSPA